MQLINQITNYPNQTQILFLPDGTSFTLTLYFIQMQYGWFISNLTYGNFVLNGLRISVNPNMLLPFQNKIPFGIACYSVANREPSLIDDFSSGAAKLYILSQAECQAYYTFLQTGVK